MNDEASYETHPCLADVRALEDDRTAETYRVLAWLLRYPEEWWLEAAGDLIEVIDGERLLGAVARNGLHDLVNQLRVRPLLRSQEAYVDLFDRTPSLSLNLYEHVFGDSRERGQAMVRLSLTYAEAGFELDSKELPDALPVFCEFLSLLPRPEAKALLRDAAGIVAALDARIRLRSSPYAAVTTALLELAEVDPRALPDEIAAGDSDSPERLDQQWEEVAVRFDADSVRAETPSGCLVPSSTPAGENR